MSNVRYSQLMSKTSLERALHTVCPPAFHSSSTKRAVVASFLWASLQACSVRSIIVFWAKLLFTIPLSTIIVDTLINMLVIADIPAKKTGRRGAGITIKPITEIKGRRLKIITSEPKRVF
ncbi:hypothetical protein V2G26_007627 [Clonostachys chloroleuca]